MIIAAVEPMYIAFLEDGTMGFSGQSANNLLTHLVDTYGEIKPSDIEKNRNRLSEPWTPNQPIETLWKEGVKDVNDFATFAQEAIPETVQIRLIKDFLKKSGVFKNAIDKWDDKTTNNTTMAQFQTHFNTEDERHLSKLNARQGGYSTNDPAANAAIGSSDLYNKAKTFCT